MLNMDRRGYATGTNAEAQITFSGRTGQAWSISGVAWSSEGGVLSTDFQLDMFIVSTTTTDLIFSMDINSAGAGFILPSEPVKFPSGQDVIFTLAAGGTGVVGKLNILGYKLV